MIPSAGDLLLVHRRRTWRSFFAGPLGALISWSIQRTTRSRWNHVAIVADDGDLDLGRHIIATWGPNLIEAEWTGVRRSGPTCYLDQRVHAVGIVRCPEGIDRAAVVAFARAQLRARYDRKLIVLMKVAALLWGHKGVRRIVQANDRAWICSELAAAAWRAGGWKGDALVPGDFAKLERHEPKGPVLA